MTTLSTTPPTERAHNREPNPALFSRALVIDDDPLFQIVVSESLIAAGVLNVETADDGVIGIEKLINARAPISLIVVDLQMPNMTGVDVVRELARVKYTGGVIIASSEDPSLMRSVRNMAKALNINILGTLSKPLDVSRLHALLEQLHEARPTRPQRVLSREQVFSAMAHGELVPFFQPKVDLESGEIAGFEVLMRHIDDAENSPAPKRYLDAIEKYGLSIEALCYMITHAGMGTKLWAHAVENVKLAFNLSPLAIQDAGLPDRLLGVVKNAYLDPRNITLEITEDRLLECTATTLEVLSLLRLYGFNLSIDDFGTGATGIEQLRTFPFTELKIDGKFMLSFADDDFSRLTVQTSAKLARMLGMNVVAEGVETIEGIEFARNAGAHQVQGFYVARAMNAERALEWLENFEPLQAEALRNHG